MKSQSELANFFAKISDPEQINKIMSEMLTERELADVALRWQLLKDLYNGETQRSIAAKHGISLCKITRGSKILKDENSAVLKLLKVIYGEKQ
jgi:TrpR family trp operon transcriptional repressor